MHRDADEAVEALYRSDWGRIVAALIRLVGDFEVAEEAAQEAFTAGVRQWRTSGVPDGYHLLHAARADLLRRLGSAAEAAHAYTRALALAGNDSERRFLESRLREVQPPQG